MIDNTSEPGAWKRELEARPHRPDQLADGRALDLIASVLSEPGGWDAETLDRVAAMVRRTGRYIAEGAEGEIYLRAGDSISASWFPELCIKECSAPGAVDDAVAYWVMELPFGVDPGAAREYLRRCGIEESTIQAMDDEDLARHILWLACCNFAEGADLYVLGD
jgi:hypothetical protein